VNLTEECEKGGPYTDEEDRNENEDFPLREISAPQERPVPSVGLGKGESESNE
jgi:hypothetical protein